MSETETHINLIIRETDGSEKLFKVKRNTKFVTLKRAYSSHRSMDVASLRLRFDGLALLNDATPDDLGMMDGDTIDNFTEQVGGSSQLPGSSTPDGVVHQQVGNDRSTLNLSISVRRFEVIFHLFLRHTAPHHPHPPNWLPHLEYLKHKLQLFPLSSRSRLAQSIGLKRFRNTVQEVIERIPAFHQEAYNRCACVAGGPENMCNCDVWKAALHGLVDLNGVLGEVLGEE